MTSQLQLRRKPGRPSGAEFYAPLVINVVCPVCGIEFHRPESLKHKRKYCSTECSNKVAKHHGPGLCRCKHHQLLEINTICRGCSVEFYASKSRRKNAKDLFCSQKCMFSIGGPAVLGPSQKRPTTCGHSDRPNEANGLCRQCDRRKRLYGIEPHEWPAIEARANGCCEICGKPSKKLHIDHDHSSSKVRGLLCYTCNVGLGSFRDSIINLHHAIKYLSR